MNHRLKSTNPAGVSLVETILAVGVLAVIIPLALGAMTAAGKVGSSARAETRAPALAERCLLEVKSAREGNSEVLPNLVGLASFPASGEVLALAFSREGRLLGPVEATSYESGVREEMDGERVTYLARVAGRFDDPGVTLTVEIEHPAVRGQEDRDRLSFHTRLP
ncbi:MAG: type IV pilus modification PilV family protein [Verrucomicrobiales bacterium]